MIKTENGLHKYEPTDKADLCGCHNENTDILDAFISEVKDGTMDAATLGGKSADSFYNLGVPTDVLPSGADLNDYITKGRYLLKTSLMSTYINLPPNVTSSSIFIIEEVVDGGCVQKIIDIDKLNNICTRVYNSYRTPSFTDWQRVAHTDNTSNPNLLINGDFRVNQRGQSSYSGFTYTVDMWRTAATNDKVDVLDNGIRFATATQYGGLIQHIEDCTKLRGKTVTLSMKISAFNEASAMGLGLNYNRGETPYAFTVPFTSIGNGFITITVDLPNDITNMYVYTNKILNDGIEVSVDIEYIKLEVGRVATPYSPRPYAEELALCQRYLLFNNIYGLAYAKTSDVIYFIVNVPTKFRTTPSLIGTPNTVNGGYVVSTPSGLQSGFTFSAFGNLENAILVSATKASHGITDLSSVYLNFVGCGLSAEL